MRENCSKQGQRRPHSHTAALVTVCCYIAAMIFFAVVRAFGLMWFQAVPPETEIPVWAAWLLAVTLFVFDCSVILKILSPATWRKAILSALICKAADIVLCWLFPNYWPPFILTAAYILFAHLMFNENKDRAMGYAVLFFAALNGYQGLMMFGRGYPLLAKFDPVWQLVGTIDYRFFLLAVLGMKGVVEMGSFCVLWFDESGVVSRVADKIGHVVLAPARAVARLVKGV